MKLFGRRRRDHGYCPGHDKFPTEKYRSRRSAKAHRAATKVCHRNGRRRAAREAAAIAAEEAGE